MAFILLFVWGVVMLLLARWVCGNWLNHLSLYTFVWTLSLEAHELHWIRYNSISTEAWLYIFLAWAAIYLGTAAVMYRGERPVPAPSRDSLRRLKLVIVILSLSGLASCLVLARQVTAEVDPNLFIALTVGAPKIYAAGLEETGNLVGIPYVAFLPYAACALAGVYSARRGRIEWVSTFPLIVVAIAAILSVSRWGVMLATALFLLSLYATPKTRPFSLTFAQKAGLVTGCVACLGLVSIARTDLSGEFSEQSKALQSISTWVPPAPSFYFYVSAPPVGLSEYLREPSREGNLHWGRYTFASVYRLFSKLGFGNYVPFHQEFFSTPEPINTCTYLREVHSDFGVIGVFVFPFLLGGLAGWLSISKSSLARVVLLAHIYVIVLFSFTYLVVITGQFFQSLVVSVIAAIFIGRQSRPSPAKWLVRAVARTAA